MAEVLLFHHAQGQTAGFHAFADELRAAGHTVHAPDLFDGRTFGSIDDGLAYVGELGGFGQVITRAERTAEEAARRGRLRRVLAGGGSGQKLAQTRPGARGALLFYSCVPVSEFGTWPTGVPVQIHGMDADPYFVDEGDVDAARGSSSRRRTPSCFSTPATSTTSRTAACPATTSATRLLTQRVLVFLRRVS